MKPGAGLGNGIISSSEYDPIFEETDNLLFAMEDVVVVGSSVLDRSGECMQLLGIRDGAGATAVLLLAATMLRRRLAKLNRRFPSSSPSSIGYVRIGVTLERREREGGGRGVACVVLKKASVLVRLGGSPEISKLDVIMPRPTDACCLRCPRIDLAEF